MTVRSHTQQERAANAYAPGVSVEVGDVLHPALSPLLLLPAYLALGIAIGSAIYSLSSLFSIADYSAKLWLAFAIAMTSSFCMQGGGRATRDIVTWVLVVLFCFLPPLILFINSKSFFPPIVFEDSNAMVAVGMGWLIILTLVVAGVQFGRAPVALTAPLVPSLSLFGLLNIMSLDPSANIRFLIFIAASLYLTAYERLFLGPIRSRLREQASAARFASAPQGGRARGAALPRTALSAAPVGRVANVTSQLLAACALWLMAFIAGGALFYWPISAAIPARLSLALSRSPLGAQPQVSDWRNSAPIVELRGGHYPLSTRTIAKVIITKGDPAGLWRTNIYQSYKGSRWLESNELGVHSVFSKKGTLTPIAQANNAFSFSPFAEPLKPETNYNQNKCEGDNCRRVIELVQPLTNTTSTLISSGEPIYIEGDLGELQVRSDVTAGISDPSKRSEPYTVSSQVLTPNQSELLSAPGLSKARMQSWLEDPIVLETLNLPDDPNQALQIRAYARRISEQAKKAGRTLDTPAHKVNAVADYLAANCVYSLNSPAVPEGQDAVLFFLRNSKRGACDMFASSMVLLLRAMQVPARLVTGYIQPESADNADGTIFTLRERDAHAWIEYYVPEIGWVSFDPTQRTRDVDGADTMSWLNLRNLPALLGNLFLPFTGLLILAATILVSGGLKRQALKRLSPEARERILIIDIYDTGRKIIARHVPYFEHQTPHEYESAVMHSSLPHDAKLEFGALTYLFVQSQYGFLNAEVDLGQAGASLRRLKTAMRSARSRPRFTVAQLPLRQPAHRKHP